MFLEKTEELGDKNMSGNFANVGFKGYGISAESHFDKRKFQHTLTTSKKEYQDQNMGVIESLLSKSSRLGE